jgi:hypothetical protein
MRYEYTENWQFFTSSFSFGINSSKSIYFIFSIKKETNRNIKF